MLFHIPGFFFSILLYNNCIIIKLIPYQERGPIPIPGLAEKPFDRAIIISQLSAPFICSVHISLSLPSALASAISLCHHSFSPSSRPYCVLLHICYRDYIYMYVCTLTLHNNTMMTLSVLCYSSVRPFLFQMFMPWQEHNYNSCVCVCVLYVIYLFNDLGSSYGGLMLSAARERERERERAVLRRDLRSNRSIWLI